MNPLPLYAPRSDRELENYCRTESIDLWSLLHPPKARRTPETPAPLPGPRPCEEPEGRCEESA